MKMMLGFELGPEDKKKNLPVSEFEAGEEEQIGLRRGEVTKGDGDKERDTFQRGRRSWNLGGERRG